MADRKKATPAQIMDVARAAQRTLNDALETAKQLKAKSRDAKRRVKAAKKAAKQATKAARAARKTAAKARRAYKKAVARAAKARKKEAKEKEAIVTPKRTSPSRNHPRAARQRDRSSERSRRRSWEVGDESDDGARARQEAATPS
jgi:translation initiation factor 2B subunit (eIF-2B alpha/beta/delta family)